MMKESIFDSVRNVDQNNGVVTLVRDNRRAILMIEQFKDEKIHLTSAELQNFARKKLHSYSAKVDLRTYKNDNQSTSTAFKQSILSQVNISKASECSSRSVKINKIELLLREINEDSKRNLFFHSINSEERLGLSALEWANSKLMSIGVNYFSFGDPEKTNISFLYYLNPYNIFGSILGTMWSFISLIKTTSVNHELLQAVLEKNLEALNLALNNGAEVNARYPLFFNNFSCECTQFSLTPLMLAARNSGDKEIVERLIQSGADIDIRTLAFDPETALDIAIAQENKVVEQCLLQKDALTLRRHGASV